MSITQSHRRHTSVKELRIVWTSDALGAVADTTEVLDGELLSVKFIPGTAAVQPDDQYDIVLNDENNFDVLAGKGLNLSNAAASEIVPLIGDGVTTNQRVPVNGLLSLAVSNAGAAKSGALVISYR